MRGQATRSLAVPTHSPGSELAHHPYGPMFSLPGGLGPRPLGGPATCPSPSLVWPMAEGERLRNAPVGGFLRVRLHTIFMAGLGHPELRVIITCHDARPRVAQRSASPELPNSSRLCGAGFLICGPRDGDRGSSPVVRSRAVLCPRWHSSGPGSRTAGRRGAGHRRACGWVTLVPRGCRSNVEQVGFFRRSAVPQTVVGVPNLSASVPPLWTGLVGVALPPSFGTS